MVNNPLQRNGRLDQARRGESCYQQVQIAPRLGLVPRQTAEEDHPGNAKVLDQEPNGSVETGERRATPGQGTPARLRGTLTPTRHVAHDVGGTISFGHAAHDFS
jgi:hypothetical protein